MPQESRDGRDRLAEYVRPTVYTPRVPSPPRRRAGWAATVVRVIRAVLGATVFLGGTPALLLFLGGNPVRRLPSWTQVVAWFDQPSGRFTPNVLTGAAIWALWLLWAVLALLLVAELLALVTRWRIPVLRLPAPLHRLVFGLAGTAAIAVTSVGTLNVADGGGRSPAAVASTEDAGVIPRQAAARGPVLIQVADTRYLYTVERHDTLSKIAKEWLGDAGRWPEICRLNKHRHFPRAGGALRDCDLIYPGWDLRLPADARPPQTATPAAPAPSRPATPPAATVTPSPPPSTAPDASSPTPSSTTNEQEAATIPGSPAPATHGVREPSPSAEPATPTVTASPSTSPPVSGPRSSAGATDEHGVQLSPANWLPWSLAAAISAAAALVWAQRRRRYTGEPDTDPPTQLPPPVVHLRRAVARNTELPNPDSPTEPPTLVPDLTPLPSGATGIAGDGGHAAARAALVAALASGDPHHPDTRGEVVIDAATLATLLGPDTAALQPWPRLHIADSIADALTVIEAKLLHRSRILNEHALTDLDTLRQHAPDEEALPPLMLIAHTPPADARTRAEAVLAFGRDLRVSALLLGEWARGATVEVTTDGHADIVSGQPDAPLPARLPVLESEAAIQILTTLREAQTGEPPAVASPALSVMVVPLHASRITKPSDRPTSVTTLPADAIAGKARLRVLGQPRIEDITQPGRPLRAKALELAVFLACHPDGMTTRDIGEYLEPDARITQADQRVHTNASNLRHVLARAGTADAKNAYLIKTAGRYRLDPTTVDVDVWTLRDLLHAAAIASGPRRRELLTAACDLSTAPLADGQDYEWLQPHRETVRRWGTEAHLLLADDLIDTDPQSASALLDKAIGLDRYNEALYTRAMHTRHALRDADGIRTLLRALTKALTDIDAEPHETTIKLANQLHNSVPDQLSSDPESD